MVLSDSVIDGAQTGRSISNWYSGGIAASRKNRRCAAWHSQSNHYLNELLDHYWEQLKELWSATYLDLKMMSYYLAILHANWWAEIDGSQHPKPLVLFDVVAFNGRNQN